MIALFVRLLIIAIAEFLSTVSLVSEGIFIEISIFFSEASCLYGVILVSTSSFKFKSSGDIAILPNCDVAQVSKLSSNSNVS